MGALKDGVPFSGGTGRGNWIRVTARRRCPICGNDTWCGFARIGSDVKCTRIAGGREGTDRYGNHYWIHSLNGSSTFEVPPLPSESRERCSDDECDRLYRALLAKLRLVDSDRKALERRGMSAEEIERGLYRTLPVDGRVKLAQELVALGADTSLPGLVLKSGKNGAYPSLAGWAGLVIPVLDSKGRVVALRIRPNSADSKYQWLSGSSSGGAGSGVHVHVPPHKGFDTSAIRITEGEIKAAIATEHTGTLTLSIPGVSMWNLALPIIEELGASRVLVAFDSDYRHKREVARALEGLLADLKRRGIAHAVETWDPTHKGVDDALVAGAEIIATEQQRELSKSEERVLDSLQTPPQRVAVATARDYIREALASAVPGDRLLGKVSPGTGKSFAAVEEIAARVARGERCAYLAKDYKALAEIESALGLRGVSYRKARGILQGSDCRFQSAVDSLQRMGCSPRATLCNGAVDSRPCEYRDGCESAKPFIGAEEALVAIGVYQMAPVVLATEPSLVIVDESPELREPATLSREQLLVATNTADVKGNERKAALALVAGSLAGMLAIPECTDPVEGLRHFAASIEGRDSWRVWQTLFPSHSIEQAFASALEFVADPDWPPRPSTTTLDRLRAGHKADEARWCTFRSLRGWARDGVGLEVDGDSLRLAWRTETARSIATAAGAVVVLDGTGNESELRRALGDTLRVIECTTEERSKVHRTIIARRGTKRAWLRDAKPNWDSPELRGSIRQLVQWVCANVPKQGRVVVATHRVLGKALERAWLDREGEAVELLEPLRGYELRWTYFGSAETRGVNAFESFDASISLGDPRPNAGEKRVAGESAEEHASASLGQFHDRLRGVNRVGAKLYSLHIGEIAPAGQWDRVNTTVAPAASGRPRQLIDAREHAQALIDRYGSVRAVARATGLHRATVEASLYREVSATVADCYVVHLSLPIRERREAEEVPSYADLTVPATKPLDITTESLGASNPTPPRTQATPLVPMEAPAPTGYQLAPWERQHEALGASTVDETADDGSTPVPGASSDSRGS